MISQSPARPAGAESLAQDALAGALGWFQRKLCGLRGHDAILQYERDRLFLRCTSCGHETPGWSIASAARAPRRVEPRAGFARIRHVVAVRRVA